MKRNTWYIVGALVIVLLLAVGCSKKDKETDSQKDKIGLQVEQNAEDNEKNASEFTEISPNGDSNSTGSNQNNNSGSDITSGSDSDSDSGKESGSNDSATQGEWGPLQ